MSAEADPASRLVLIEHEIGPGGRMQLMAMPLGSIASDERPGPRAAHQQDEDSAESDHPEAAGDDRGAPPAPREPM